MPYYEPTDLPALDPAWQDWPLEQRLAVAKELSRELLPGNRWAFKSAVAISMVEQPGKIPNGNCCGWMCQARRKPWGWSPTYWQIAHPVGWVGLREGQTGRVAPFLAFEEPGDSLLVCAYACHRRGIRTGEDYALHWVGLPEESKRFAGVARAFDSHLRKVKELWP